MLYSQRNDKWFITNQTKVDTFLNPAVRPLTQSVDPVNNCKLKELGRSKLSLNQLQNQLIFHLT